MPYIFQSIFDGGIVRKNESLLYDSLTALMAALVSFAVGIAIQERAMSRLGSKAASSLRVRLFNRVLAMPVDQRPSHNTSSLLDRMGGDLEQVEVALVRGVPLLVAQGLIVAISVALLFAIEWRLALVVLASLPLTLALSAPFNQRARRAKALSEPLRARMLKLTGEVSDGHSLLRILGAGRLMADRFGNLLDQLGVLQVRSVFLSAMGARSAQVTSGLTQLVVIGFGGWLAFRGDITGGLLVAFITLLGNVSGGIGYIAEGTLLTTKGITALSGIERLLISSPLVADAAGALPFTAPRDAIAFDRVSFAYDEVTVLEDVSFSVAVGEKVCLVGPSGSGKSTALHLLARLLEPSSGRILIDGQSIALATDRSLRTIMTMVPQNPILFAGTVLDNITLGRPNASDDAVQRAIRAAALHETIASFQEGVFSDVGDGGGSLSGGQRQRVAIARALVRDAPLLLLDEATSALDPESEAVVNETISGLGADYTVLAVTHRIITAPAFDRVLVFDRGRLVQQGSHEQLVGEPGLYSQLWQRASRLPALGAQNTITLPWLRSLPFLAGCPEPLLQSLSPFFLSHRLPEDRDVFRQGDPGKTFFIVIRGIVDVMLESADGRSRRIAVLRDGDFFGESALISGQPRNATIRTVTDCEFLTLHRDPFLTLLSRNAEVAEAVRIATEDRAPGRRSHEHGRSRTAESLAGWTP